MELVDIGDSKSPAAMRGGSSPPTGTTFWTLTVWLGFFYAWNLVNRFDAKNFGSTDFTSGKVELANTDFTSGYLLILKAI